MYTQSVASIWTMKKRVLSIFGQVLLLFIGHVFFEPQLWPYDKVCMVPVTSGKRRNRVRVFGRHGVWSWLPWTPTLCSYVCFLYDSTSTRVDCQRVLPKSFIVSLECLTIGTMCWIDVHTKPVYWGGGYVEGDLKLKLIMRFSICKEANIERSLANNLSGEWQLKHA